MHFGSAWITGASSGLGAAFTRQLAAGGTRRFVLWGRDAAALETVRGALGPAAEAECRTADFTAAGACRNAAAMLAENPPDLLVLNAGAGVYGEFAAGEAATQTAMIDLNVRAVAGLAHAYLNAVRARRAGSLLVVASAAAFVPLPYEAVYAATKAFLVQWGEAVAEELRGTGIRLRVFCPGFTATHFAARAGLPAAVQFGRPRSADAAAVRGLRAFDGRRVTVADGALLQAATSVVRGFPAGLVRRAAGAWMRRGLGAPD